jgi:hypothetical protein
MFAVSYSGPVEVAQEIDLGPVVDELSLLVEHHPDQRVTGTELHLREVALNPAKRHPQLRLAQPFTPSRASQNDSTGARDSASRRRDK